MPTAGAVPHKGFATKTEERKQRDDVRITIIAKYRRTGFGANEMVRLKSGGGELIATAEKLRDGKALTRGNESLIILSSSPNIFLVFHKKLKF